MAGSAVDDTTALRRALGSFLTGVTIVTTVDRTGQYRGLTANSFTSVSLDPPLVLVCVDRSAPSHATFAECGGFGVHVLAHDQQDLSTRFAAPSPDKFAGLECRPGTGGAPLLPESAAWLDCETYRRVDAGDHVVLFGRVRDFGVSARRPLGYLQGRYIPLAPQLDLGEDQTGRAVTVAWVADTAGDCMVLRERRGGWTLPHSRLHEVRLDDEALSQVAQRCFRVPAEVHFLYSVYDVAGELVLVYRVRLSGSLDEPPAGHRVFGIGELPWDAIPEPHTESVLRRYVRERAGDSFGLYAGSAARGRLATVHDIAPDA